VTKATSGPISTVETTVVTRACTRNLRDEVVGGQLADEYRRSLRRTLRDPGGTIKTVEDDEPRTRVVVVEFPTMKHAHTAPLRHPLNTSENS
jgi:hypothetical protein